MPQKLIGLIFVFVLGLVTAVSTPLPTTAAVPDGLTPADWAQIQSQVAPHAVATWGQQAKLNADDPIESGRFGSAVAVSGDTAVVGAWYDDDGGIASGSAYVFTRTGTGWSQQAKLTASDAAAGDWFGNTVAISGDTAVIGAHRDDGAFTDSGSAYIFTRSEGMWSEQAKLTATDSAADDSFGYAVAISGDTAVIGAWEDDDGGSASGSAYVFTRSGAVWSEQAKLTASDAAEADHFGVSVAVSDDTAVIGAYRNDGGDTSPDSGSAYVFTRDGEAMWSQQAKLTASDSAEGDQFGRSVAVSGDTAVIGADYDDDGFTNSGSAYIFSRSGTTWSQQAKLTASDPAEFDYFGFAVAISGDTAVIGMFLDDDGGNQSGSAYVFSRSGTTWSQQAKLTASDAAADDYFGSSVAVSGDTAVIGAYLDSPENITGSGSAYIFTLDENEYILTVGTAGEGSGQVQSDPAGTAFPPGSEVTLTAVASPGSTFTGWSGDVTSTENPLMLTMDSSKTITATFALNQYDISLMAEPTAGGTVIGGGNVVHGQMVTVTATAETGYTFLHWAEGEEVVSTAESYSFTAVGDRTLVAYFIADAQPTIYLPLIVR